MRLSVEIGAGPAQLSPGELPRRLAEVHQRLQVGALVELDVDAPAAAGIDTSLLVDLGVGAGFDVLRIESRPQRAFLCRLRRAHTLADSVGPGMTVLVCGLNPSVLAADRGVPFVRAGNRFWPAALASGLVTVDRDPRHALESHRVGMTDLVKRATPGAAELTAAEYRSGLGRVERLCGWLVPRVVCFVGLSGWRYAADGQAHAGLQDGAVAGRPVYLMPSTSGRNAHARLDVLVDHLRAVLELAREHSCHTPSSY